MTKKYKQLKDTWRIKAGEEWTQLNEDLTLYLHYGTQTLEKESVIKENPSWFQEITEPKQSFKRWRAEIGGEYFFVRDRGDVGGSIEEGDRLDNYRYLTLNYFQTEQEAESYKARQEAIGRVTHAIIEANEGWDPEDDDIMWTISWNTNGYRPLNLMHNSTMLPVLFPWMNTRGIALSIISSHKEDLDLIFNLKKVWKIKSGIQT